MPSTLYITNYYFFVIIKWQLFNPLNVLAQFYQILIVIMQQGFQNIFLSRATYYARERSSSVNNGP